MKKSHTIHPSSGAGLPIKLQECQCGVMHNSAQFCSCSAKKNTSSCPVAEPKKKHNNYVLLQNQKIQHLCSAASSTIPTQHQVSTTTTMF